MANISTIKVGTTIYNLQAKSLSSDIRIDGDDGAILTASQIADDDEIALMISEDPVASGGNGLVVTTLQIASASEVAALLDSTFEGDDPNDDDDDSVIKTYPLATKSEVATALDSTYSGEDDLNTTNVKLASSSEVTTLLSA